MEMDPKESGPPDFELERVIDVEPARLHAFLCDLHNYVPLHPFIESIVDLPPEASLPGARRYRVVDRIPMGPFRMKTVYVAALEPVNENEVHGHAWQSPGIRLHTIYRHGAITRDARPGAGGRSIGTRLTEQCRIVAAPWGMAGFVRWQARKAHAETLDGLKALLENSAPA